jgi:hypothetical protein
MREEELSVCTQCVGARQHQQFEIKEKKRWAFRYVLILFPFSCYISLALFSTFHSFLVRTRNVDKGNGPMQRNIQSVTRTHIFRTLLSRDTVYNIQTVALQAKAYRKMSTQTKIKSGRGYFHEAVSSCTTRRGMGGSQTNVEFEMIWKRSWPNLRY